MTNYDKVSGAGTLRLTVSLLSQNIAANQSTIYWELRLLCGNGVSHNTAPPTGWTAGIDVTPYTGGYTFDFRSSIDQFIASDTRIVTHSPDGTKVIVVSAHSDHTGTAAIGGPIDISGLFPLPRIPRGPKVEQLGAWQQSIAHTEIDGAWQTALAHVEDNGIWKVIA